MTRARDNADLGDSYGVLGSGVTGGSGLTALGTVTAGNLSNTAIVYPAGHIIQVVSDYSEVSANTSNSTGVTAVSDTITLANATNKLLVFVTISFSMAVSGATSDFYWGCSLECTSDTTVIFGPANTTGYFSHALNTTTANFITGWNGYSSFQHLFEPDYASEITVTAKAHNYTTAHGGKVTVNSAGDSGMHGKSTMTLMEVVSA